MKIEFLYARQTGRPEAAEEALRWAIEATGVDAEITYTEVDGMEDARTKRFLGSPSIRIEGLDVEYAEREPDEYQAGVRYYNSPDGWKAHPHARLIANVILETMSKQGQL